MGKGFGNLARITGVTFFRLSPYEQKAFAGFFEEGVPNTVRRFTDSVMYYAPFFLFMGVAINWANEENRKMKRKKPEDYANDT